MHVTAPKTCGIDIMICSNRLTCTDRANFGLSSFLSTSNSAGMLTRQSGFIFRNTVGQEQDIQPGLPWSNDLDLFNEITREGRTGTSTYLLKVREYLQQPDRFTTFLRKVKGLKDGR